LILLPTQPRDLARRDGFRASPLRQSLTADTIVISSGEEQWKNQSDILQSAARFQANGGKLIRLEFPGSEIQRFGDVAITYSQYLYETEVDPNWSSPRGASRKTKAEPSSGVPHGCMRCPLKQMPANWDRETGAISNVLGFRFPNP
jgi:hypothetical protein